jgi:hypothetical protein
MFFYLSIILGKLVALLSYILKIGAGSTWPGHLALIFDKNFLKKFLKKILIFKRLWLLAPMEKQQLWLF